VIELHAVRFAVFDFDGVFTDNRGGTDQHGDESIACWRGDALGLRRLAAVGVEHLILSTEVNAAVGARARKIGASCIQGVDDKLPVLQEEASRRGVGLEMTSYLGNDVNDADCLEAVGLPVVPADAWPEVVPLAGLVLTRRGGYGCVRELCDAVWLAKKEAA